MPVSELLARISSRELSEWICYFGLEGPAGEVRADWRAALVAATVANVNRDPKRRAEPFLPKDFMPEWDSTAQESGATDRAADKRIDQQVGLAKRLAKVLGGRITVGEG
jgi:hypothetical protein